MNKTPSELWSDFMTFSKVYVEIGDADPMYPVIKRVCDHFDMDTEQRVEFCFWYMAWYNLRSAIQAYLDDGKSCENIGPDQAKFTIKLERRGLRGGTNIRKHWDSQCEQVRKAGGWLRWVEQGGWQTKQDSAMVMDYQQWNWLCASRTIQQVWNNGRWAAYKGCELLEKVCGLPLRAPDMGHADSSNPRKALNLLFSGMPAQDDNSKSAIKTLDDASLDLMQQAEGVYGVELGGDLALLETCCCGFYSLHRGDYYLGCDIDLMLEVAMEQDDKVRSIILGAREGIFPDEYLGEKHGWSIHDKPRLRVYRDTGDIVVR